jgi:hypothetical protein
MDFYPFFCSGTSFSRRICLILGGKSGIIIFRAVYVESLLLIGILNITFGGVEGEK